MLFFGPHTTLVSFLAIFDFSLQVRCMYSSVCFAV
jgi:hypothetical protein